MTSQEQIAELEKAKTSITLVQESLAAVPPADVIHVSAGQSIQAAVDRAPDGATIAIEAATYDEPLTLQKSVMLVPAQPLRHGRAARDTGVWITSAAEGTITITGSGITVAGLGVTNREPSYDAVDITGSRVLIDRCTVVGDPAHGMRRGFLTHGATTKILGCWVDDVFNLGRDTCCIGGWEMTEPPPARLRDFLRRAPAPSNVLVDDCYLRGGAETMLYGGADTTSAAKIPEHITVTHSTLTHNPAWYGMGVQIKTPLELKCCRHVYIADCTCEWAGVAEGQGAYLLVLTVRNQDGNAVWSCVEDVLIERCVFRHGGGGINFLGYDDQYPSGELDGVTVRNCAFLEMNPAGPWQEFTGYWGSGRCTMFNNVGRTITLDAITMDGVGMGALGNFANVPKQPVGLTLRNWRYCPTEYGWKIDDGGMDIPPAHANISALMPDLAYEITATDAGAVGYPGEETTAP